MSILNAFEDLFKSIYELLASFVGTIATIFSTIISAILSFFTGLINMVADIFGGVVNVLGGVSQFIVGNIVVIAVIAAGGWMYMRQQQGKPVVPAKKTN